MSSNDTIADPTDWIGTPLSSLSSLEAALQCHVCKELFDTPVITSCSHTFCSLCIRRCLSQEGRCPACRSGDQESKLRRNWAMEECVNVHRKQRHTLLEFARRAAQDVDGTILEGTTSRPAKRRRTQEYLENDRASELPVRSTRSQRYKALQTRSQNPELSVVQDSDEQGSEYSGGIRSSQLEEAPATPDDGLVACPVCQQRMKEGAVFAHLDQCEGGKKSSGRQLNRETGRRASSSVAYNVVSPTKSRQRLGALNYSLLSETSLRKKLAEIGIPNHGSKPLMQKRHGEWLNLWNANCDSTSPKSKRDLLRELDVWERTQGRQIANAQGPSGVMSKSFDAEKWTRKNEAEFDELIKRAKAKSRQPASTGSKYTISKEQDSDTQPQTSKPTADPDSDQSPPNNGVVDLTSPTKATLEQQQSQGSQVSGVAA